MNFPVWPSTIFSNLREPYLSELSELSLKCPLYTPSNITSILSKQHRTKKILSCSTPQGPPKTRGIVISKPPRAPTSFIISNFKCPLSRLPLLSAYGMRSHATARRLRVVRRFFPHHWLQHTYHQNAPTSKMLIGMTSSPSLPMYVWQ